MKKINKLAVSLLAFSMASTGLLTVPQAVSAQRINHPVQVGTNIPNDSANRFSYKLRNPSYRRKIYKRNKHSQKYMSAAYDISQWQGRLTASEIRHLKHEVRFMIVRVQYGVGLYDNQAKNNIKLLSRYHIPYGVYSYSLYHSPASARREARYLHKRAPHADFYVNDIEENRAGSRKNLNASTKAWAKEMHNVTKRPAVIYSDLSFMSGEFTRKTRDYYNAIWLAAYGPEPFPNYHYDLWQRTSKFRSHALGMTVDDSVFPKYRHKPLSFWTDGTTATSPKHKAKTIIVNPTTSHYGNLRKRVNAISNDVAHMTFSKHSSRRTLINKGNKAYSDVQELKNLSSKYPSAPKALKYTMLKDENALISKINNINKILSKRKAKVNTKRTTQRKKSSHSKRMPMTMRIHYITSNVISPFVSKKTRRAIKRYYSRKRSPRKVRHYRSHIANRRHAYRGHRKRSYKHKISNAWLHKYYVSKRIHTVKVRGSFIRLYHKYNLKYYKRIKRGALITHVHFRRAVYKNHRITRTVGKYHGRWVEATSKKSLIKPSK